MEKAKYFEREINLIQNEDYRMFVAYYLKHYCPEYFWEIGASSSGKYHPQFSQGKGGLVRHTKAVVMFAEELLRMSSYMYMSEEYKDYVIMACIVHDTCKYGMSEFDKAKAIYTYLGENVEYVNDDSENQKKVIMKTHYLYEAICKKKTNCDGFANAFSLLCSMNGIKNFEKMDDPKKDEIGHTWNAVLLDGIWYNVDATGAKEVTAEDWSKDLFSRFAYSDKVQTEKPVFSKITPDCKVDTIFVGCTLDSCDDEDAVRKVAKAYRNSEGDFFVVIVKKGTNDEINDMMQDVAYYIYAGFETVTLEGSNKKLVYVNK